MTNGAGLAVQGLGGQASGGSDDSRLERGEQVIREDQGGIEQRLAGLSPSQRALLERGLIELRFQVARDNTIQRREGSGPAPLSNSQELLYLPSQVFDDGVA